MLVNQPMRTVFLTLFVLSVACVSACSQKEGERCQRDEDCDPLICVGSSGIGVTGESGYCCTACDRGAVAYWDPLGNDGSGSCECTDSTTDGDSDVDSDVDSDSDTDVDGDGDADGDVSEDGGDGGDAEVEGE